MNEVAVDMGDIVVGNMVVFDIVFSGIDKFVVVCRILRSSLFCECFQLVHQVFN